MVCIMTGLSAEEATMPMNLNTESIMLSPVLKQESALLAAPGTLAGGSITPDQRCAGEGVARQLSITHRSFRVNEFLGKVSMNLVPHDSQYAERCGP
jgi:hypothetical protein